MNKKTCCLLSAVLLVICMAKPALAKHDSLGYDDSNLRIFTPFHTVKSVFLQHGTGEYEIQFSENDIKLIAGVVYAESKGEPFLGKVGVASVILNRLSSPQFPKSVKDVIYQKNAFSCVSNGYIAEESDKDSYDAVIDALNGNDPTGDAVFFYNPETASSSWMKNVSKCNAVTIGNHIFFK